MFYVCFTLIGSSEGRKNFGIWIFLNKNLQGYKTNNFLCLTLRSTSDINIVLLMPHPKWYIFSCEGELVLGMNGSTCHAMDCKGRVGCCIRDRELRQGTDIASCG